MKDETLASVGTILTKTMPRDAVHFAVVQVTASRRLLPGAPVRIMDNGAMQATTCSHTDRIGIVDPFLKAAVLPGQSFWLFLNPGSITSLKHHWTHPDIPEPNSNRHPSGMTYQEAENHLRHCAGEWDLEFTDLIEGASNPEEQGRSIDTRGITVQGWDELSQEAREKFWSAMEVVFGREFESDHRESTVFQCCC